jgi:hypothetical protein
VHGRAIKPTKGETKMRKQAVRESTDIRPTAEDKGLEMTIVVKCYDNGQIYIDGGPTMGRTEVETALNAAATLTQKLGELLSRQSARIHKARRAGAAA